MFGQNLLGLQHIPRQFFLQVYYTFRNIGQTRYPAGVSVPRSRPLPLHSRWRVFHPPGPRCSRGVGGGPCGCAVGASRELTGQPVESSRHTGKAEKSVPGGLRAGPCGPERSLSWGWQWEETL